MITIGSTKIDTKLFLAPLSGVSDLAFRLIAREHGAKFCFYEMVDSNSLIYEKARKTAAILRTSAKDAPIAAQILGEDPDVMLKAARKLLATVRTPFLDINAACPAKKVVRKEAGSRLLVKQDTLFAIVKKLALGLPVPVTVKIRIGYDRSDIPAIVKVAKGCAASGASAIFVHGRTREQGYAGEIDYEAIRAIRDSVAIPVIASGNIFNGPLAKKMFDRTSCDGILIARGAMGSPWIFGEIEEYLERGKILPPVDLVTKQAVLAKHLAYIEEYKDLSPYGKVGYMRKFVMWYLKGVPHATRIRERACSAKTYAEMLGIVRSVETEEAVLA